MFRHGVRIGRVCGIVIDLDYSSFLIVGLLAWLLAVSYCRAEFPNPSTNEYWVLGVITAVTLFVSMVIHEFGHSVVALHYGISVPRITLFIFGGVSQLEAEPPNPGAEFWIAVVGPIVSFALAAFFWELRPLLVGSPRLFALAKYLASLNMILAEFDLLPGFPLDGGRVFRAIVWRITGECQFATLIVGVIGRFLGSLLIFVGVWQVLSQHFIHGLWIAFIGCFLESAAGSQLQQERLRSVLGEHRGARCDEAGLPSRSGYLQGARLDGTAHFTLGCLLRRSRRPRRPLRLHRHCHTFAISGTRRPASRRGDVVGT
jgi:Zn-dependent protease